MTKKCICQICTCGRHKCPHNPIQKPPTEPCSYSEYANQYLVHPIEPRVSYKPEMKAPLNSGPLDDKTTHKTDYVTHQLERPVQHQHETWVKPEGDMDLMTQYHMEYTQKALDPAKTSRRPLEPRQVNGKFCGEPTYQADYRKWDSQPREKNAKPDQKAYAPPSQPFQGDSNYNSDYVRHRIQPTRSMKPTEQPVRSDKPFDEVTDYNSSYVKHALPAKVEREREVWMPNPAKLEDLSNYASEYTAKSGKKADSFKPDRTPYSSQAPFDEKTTQKVDYVQWPIDRLPAREQPDVYRRPEGEMNMETTTRVDYDEKPLELNRQSHRPLVVKRTPGKFDGTTNYNSDYLQWSPGQRAQNTHKKEEYHPSELPFDGQATYSRDYPPKKWTPPAASLKPVETTGQRNRAPLETGTEYNKEFTRKEAEPCPVMAVQSGAHDGYSFRVKDDGGHHWYDEVKAANLVADKLSKSLRVG